MKYILGLDLDGTLADHTEEKIRLAKKFGYELEPPQTTSRAFREHIPREHRHAILTELYDHRAEHVPPMPGVKAALDALADRGWEFRVISRRGSGGHENARKWIARELGHLITPEHIFFVEQDHDKDVHAKAQGVVAYVDDQARVLDAMPSVETKILFDPHQEEPARDDFASMKRWDDLARILESLL